MRIGVNALYLIPGGVGGTEIYLRCLLAALAEIDSTNEYVVFTNRETGTDLVPVRPNFRHAPQKLAAVNRVARIAWEQTVLPWRARGLDVLLNPGFTAPLAATVPNVTVFHDLQHKRHPENFRWFDLPFWRLLLWGSAHRSVRLIADSAATRDDLLRFYRLDAARVSIIPLGVDPAFFGIAARRNPQRYLLASSTLHPHKNLDGLLRAYAQFRRQCPGFRLVVTGLRGFFTDELEKLRRDLSLEEDVEFTGWLPREQLYDLFAGAWAFFYPSRFEGFGLPVAEALAAGVPTVCSDIRPLSDIAGDAALRFDPADDTALAAAMRAVVDDGALRAHLSAAGPERVREYTWERTAGLTLDALTRR
ncbi:MAG: glycosyltransferase family 4 protein [Bryobacterales bacterium]|nr:glycosyltransferase family 4 protein [Bryobacterales bacterium]